MTLEFQVKKQERFGRKQTFTGSLEEVVAKLKELVQQHGSDFRATIIGDAQVVTTM